MEESSVLHKISVVTPVFGRDDCFKTIEFLRKQPYWGQLHFIIVDNGNKPELSAKLKSLASDEIDVISYERNLGGSGAYIGGVEHAMMRHQESDFIWLLDDDAEVNAETLPKLYEVMREKLDAGIKVAGIVSTIVSRQRHGEIVESGALYRPGRKVYLFNHQKIIDTIEEETHECTYGAAASMLITKKCVAECGFFENLFLHEDDIEWGYRVTHVYGFHMFGTTKSYVVHPEFQGISKSGAWVTYYNARNVLWVCRKYSKLATLKRTLEHFMRRFYLSLHGDKVLIPLLKLAYHDYKRNILKLRSELPTYILPSELDEELVAQKPGTVVYVGLGAECLDYVHTKLPDSKIKTVVYERKNMMQGVKQILILLDHIKAQLYVWFHPGVPVIYDYIFARHKVIPLFGGRKHYTDIVTVMNSKLKIS